MPTIKRILADVQCDDCGGRKCQYCNYEGVRREWIDFKDVLDEIKSHIKEKS